MSLSLISPPSAAADLARRADLDQPALPAPGEQWVDCLTGRRVAVLRCDGPMALCRQLHADGRAGAVISEPAHLLAARMRRADIERFWHAA